MKKRPVVFITCPITPRSQTKNHAVEYLNNIQEAANYGAILLQKGFAVYCPANNFPFWLVNAPSPTLDDIYEADLNMLAKADVVVAIGKFVQSVNCRREIAYAEFLDIPVFYCPKDLERWKEEKWEMTSL